MKRTVQCFPDGKFYTPQELETYLNFKYLPQLSFETPLDKDDIQARGLEQLKHNKVSQQSLELGNQFIEKIEAASIPSVSIKWLGEHLGFGLFAEEQLETGSYVGEYTGIVRKNDRRYFEPLNNYCYEYPVPDYMGRSFVIDATAGNVTRFINHSFTPNLQPIPVFYGGFYHIIFLALQVIEKGTQLCYNYGQNYWYVRQSPMDL